MQKLPFTNEEILGIDYRLSDDVPVKVWRDSHEKCFKVSFYILEEVDIGHQFPHLTFDLYKNQAGYRLTDAGYSFKIFGKLLRMPAIKAYRKRLGIASDSERHYYYIQMPLLNSVEAYFHRMLELQTQIKTIADLKRRNLLK